MNIFFLLNSLLNKDSVAYCKTALSQEASLDKAVYEVSNKLVNFYNFDIAIVFISTHFSSDFPRLLPLLKKRLRSKIWIGCAGGGVIGTTEDGEFHESDNIPSLSITLLNLPGAEIKTFHLPEDAIFDLDNPAKLWSEHLHIENINDSSAVMFFDPNMKTTNEIVNTLDFAFPQSNIIGGIAGYHNASHGSLFYGDDVCKGVVGFLIKGAWKVKTLVTKGVKPIGPIMEVESVKKNVLLELRDKDKLGSPVEFLQQLISDLSENERTSLKQSLFLGVENENLKISSNGQLLSKGTFVVRDLLGIDPNNGAVAVGEVLKVGQKVQFHSRDSLISKGEIEKGLKRLIEELPANEKPLLTIILTCLGRGKSFYGVKNGDVDSAKESLGKTPLCGASFHGEIGQINGSTSLHGYSACWGLLVRNN